VKIRTKYHAFFAELLGCTGDTIQADRLTVASLIDVLEKKHLKDINNLVMEPDTGRVGSLLMIFINGQRANLSVELHDGDEVDFMVPISGG